MKKPARKNQKFVKNILKKTPSKASKITSKKVSRKPAKRKSAPFKRVIQKIKSKIRSKSKQKKDMRLAASFLTDGFVEVRERAASPPRGFELPSNYGDNKMALLVRDPWWIFSYWEVNPAREGEVMDAMRREGQERDKTVLRVYDVTDVSLPNAHSYFDIELGFIASNWYIDVGNPNRQWVVELGIRSRNGRFFMLVRSNVVRTPRFGVSDVLDEEWMLPDDVYWKIFGLAGGLGKQKSSLDVREILERFLKNITSSESSSSLGFYTRDSQNNAPSGTSARVLVDK